MISKKRIIGNWDTKFMAWRVYHDLSDIQPVPKKTRLGISGGLLSLGSNAVGTSDINTGGTYSVSQKSYLVGEGQEPDVFLDIQTSQYLYAKVNLSTYKVDLEYSSSPPHGTGAITLLSTTIQRFPLAYISGDGVIIDLRPIGGGGGTTSYDPFEVYASTGLVVKVSNGTIIWHDKQILVASVPDITCGASTTTHIWISLDNEFSATTPTATVNNGTGGWSGYPTQPNPPARRHLLLASVVTDTTSVTSAGVIWKGNIVWPTVFGFWV